MKEIPSEQKNLIRQLRKQRKRLMEQKKWSEALDVIDQMLTLEPTFGRWNNRGVILMRLKRRQEALESFKKAWEIEPDNLRVQKRIEKVKKVLAEKSELDSDEDTALDEACSNPTPQEIGEISLENSIVQIPATQESEISEHFINHYRILEPLGQGGMGMVYLVEDPKLKRKIALKTILLADDEDLVKRFMREAEAMAQLSHPNIAKVYDIGRAQGLYYFTMEYILGETLAEKLNKKALPLHQNLQTLYQVALAIDYAHEKGIFHRDLKPANIMINDKGQPVVMDFGLALAKENETRLSRSGDIVGTPAYMSPEQAEGKREEIDERSDVYCLGAVLYQMLTGKLPFTGPSHVIIYDVLEKDPIAPRNIVNEVPIEAENICLKAMAKEKEQRYQSAYELAKDIERYLKGQVVMAMPSSSFYRIKKWVLRNRLLASVIVIFGIMILTIIFTSYWQINKQAQKAFSALEKAQKEKERALLAKKKLDIALEKTQKAQGQIRKLLIEAQQKRKIAKKAEKDAKRALQKAKKEKLKAQIEQQKTKDVEMTILHSAIVGVAHEDIRNKLNAMRTLQAFGERAAAATSSLIKTLYHKNGEVRIEAAITLGFIGASAQKAIFHLVKALAQWRSSTKKYVAKALIKIGSGTIRPLEKLLQTSDRETKVHIMQILKELREKKQ